MINWNCYEIFPLMYATICTVFKVVEATMAEFLSVGYGLSGHGGLPSKS